MRNGVGRGFCLTEAVIGRPAAYGQRELVIATVLAGLAAGLLLWRGPILWAAAGLALLAMARLARARLGGLTGDVYGAIIELAETAALVAACLG